jgi:hypothetical protein
VGISHSGLPRYNGVMNQRDYSEGWDAETLAKVEKDWVRQVPGSSWDHIDITAITALLYDGPGVVLLKGLEVKPENLISQTLLTFGNDLGTPISQNMAGELV